MEQAQRTKRSRFSGLFPGIPIEWPRIFRKVRGKNSERKIIARKAEEGRGMKGREPLRRCCKRVLIEHSAGKTLTKYIRTNNLTLCPMSRFSRALQANRIVYNDFRLIKIAKAEGSGVSEIHRPPTPGRFEKSLNIATDFLHPLPPTLVPSV